MRKTATRQSLARQASEILKLAEASGVQSNYFFVTTFKKYQEQDEKIEYLNSIFEKNKDGGEEVDARQGILEINRAIDSANKTLNMLLKIIRIFEMASAKQDEDPLMNIINGDNDGE